LLHPKKLLCVPHGGLNDTLCQIEKCREYALRHGRDLYIDTRRSGLLTHFDTFFDVNSSSGVRCTTRVDEALFAKLNVLSVFPPAVMGRIGKYSNRYCPERRLQIDQATNVVLSFDFGAEYEEELIVHEQHGGGLLSTNLMSHLKFSVIAKSYISLRLAALPSHYDAIHIRHTDYKTDYVNYLLELKQRVANKHVLICSDNAEVIAETQNLLSESKVFAVTEVPNLNGKPLHRVKNYNSENERIDATLRSLTDLIALAGSEKLYFTNIQKGHPSGFSRLASFLHDQKTVVHSLIGIA
jgi:hypothetical protein